MCRVQYSPRVHARAYTITSILRMRTIVVLHTAAHVHVHGGFPFRHGLQAVSSDLHTELGVEDKKSRARKYRQQTPKTQNQ